MNINTSNVSEYPSPATAMAMLDLDEWVEIIAHDDRNRIEQDIN